MISRKHEMKPKRAGMPGRNYYIAAVIIVVLAIIFVLAQQEPLSVDGKNGKDHAPTREQVIARLVPHLDAEAELANSSYKNSKPAVELLSAETLAQKLSKDPQIYSGAKAGNYEVRYNDLLVFFDYDANRVSGIFIIDTVTMGNPPQK